MSTERIRINLTNDQQEQLQRESGHAIEAVELNAQELESRIAPSSASPYLVIKMTDTVITSVQH